MSQDDTQLLISNPTQHFTSPEALVQSDSLSREAKIAALKQWDMEVRQLQVATEESMPAASKASLTDVHVALRALGYEPDGSHEGGEKGGHLK